MILKNISLINFKNIEQADLELSPKLNCFVGNNGMGKTNFLDAVYYLSFCRSVFSQTNQHVLKHGQDSMILQGIYEMPDCKTLNIYCGLKSGQRKVFKKNGKEYKKISEHIGLIPLVIISPDDSEFIHGTSECRRKFMDITISQYSQVYLKQLIKYNQVLQQRNALLKSETMPDETILTAYDKMMSDAACDIYNERKAFTSKIITRFKDIYQLLGEESEDVGLTYRSHLDTSDLFSILQASHQKEHIVGHTLYGIHRDDLEMTLNQQPLRYEGSQGQTKSYLIALRLSQYLFLKDIIENRTPLLLLDDIFDKLDANRVEKIIRIVASDKFGQIFITSTNRDNLEQVVRQASCDYRFFVVNNGKYEKS
jgi:DNA replication and repair protein RecF